jgi:phage gp46-like protein
MTLGAGWYGAGIGPAGYDPVIPPDAARSVRPPNALQFDGASRDYVLDANGFYAESHPVDQRVALALCISRGAIAAVPGLGNRLRTIQRVTQRVAETLARQYVNEALADLLAAKSIVIRAIDVQASSPGRLLVAVTYTNLEIDRSEARTVTADLAYV